MPLVTSLCGNLQQAVIEKYRHCDDSISKLLDWVERMERRVANQERIQEDVSSLRNQINIVKVRGLRYGCVSVSFRSSVGSLSVLS